MKDTGSQQSGGRSSRGGASGAGLVTQSRCRNCGKTDRNVRTCQEVEETSGTDGYIECTWFFVFVVEQLPLEVRKVRGLLICAGHL